MKASALRPLRVLALLALMVRPAQADEASRSEAAQLLAQAYERVNRGDVSGSNAALLRAESILSADKGADPEMVGNVLHQLGENALGRNEFASAERYLRRALEVRLKSAGERDLRPAMTQALLGEALLRLDRHEPAAEMLERATETFERYELNPPLTERYGRALYVYGEALEEKNRLPDALKAYEHAEKLLEAANDAVGRVVRVQALFGIASMALNTGDLLRAETVSRQAGVLAKALSPANEDAVVFQMGQLAEITARKGDQATAEALFKEALARGESKLGTDAQTTVQVRFGLVTARALAANRDEPIDKADTDRLFAQLIPIYEKRSPLALAALLDGYGLYLDSTGRTKEAEAPLRRALALARAATGGVRTTTLSNLALVVEKQQKVDEAEALLRQAIAAGEKAEGTSPVGAMQILAGILMQRGKQPEALSMLHRAQDALDRELDDLIKGASDAQRRTLLARSNRNSRLPLTLHLQAMAGDRGAASLALRTILRQKGRALDAGHSAVELLRRRADPSDAKLLDELTAARNELAQSTLLATPISARKELQAKVNRLEETLGRRFSEIAAEAKPVEVEDVRAVLRPDQALVEIAAYRRLESTRWGEERYAAYVLFPNGAIEARDLGEASKIDALARRVRAAIGQGGAFHDDARALDEAVLRPIRGLLGDTRDVWLSAEGALHIVPFDALVDESDRYAIDRYRFNLVTSGRDLLRYADTSKRAPNTAPLILAAPDFDANVSAPTGGAHIEGIRFPALPGTDVEATRIATLVPDAQRVVGAKATKEALVGVHGPRLLHIASHGFFLTPSAAELRAAKAESRGLTLETEAKASFVVPVDPLVRSGIALAGANRSPERALVTALEASSLDLWGTELVTLSACETGLGEVERGEGVFGLRRALVLAGAETQMMSLWKVDDDATAALMVSYYDNILKGKGRSDALREAQLSMLANPATKHPFYWAAFIVSGDDRTLDRRAPTAPREVKTAIVSETIKRAGPIGGPPPTPRPRACSCELLGVETESPAAPVALVAGAIVVALRRRRADRGTDDHSI